MNKTGRVRSSDAHKLISSSVFGLDVIRGIWQIIAFAIRQSTRLRH